MGKNINKKWSKNFTGKYSQKPLDHAKQSATNAFRTAWKRAIQKTALASGDLIGKKAANRITKASTNLQQNNSDTATNDQDKEKNI